MYLKVFICLIFNLCLITFKCDIVSDSNEKIKIDIETVFESKLFNFVSFVKNNTNLLTFIATIFDFETPRSEKKLQTNVVQLYCLFIKTIDYVLRFDEWDINVSIKYTPLILNNTKLIIYFINDTCDDKLLIMSQKININNSVLFELQADNNINKIKFYYDIRNLSNIQNVLLHISNKIDQQFSFHKSCIFYITKNEDFDVQYLNFNYIPENFSSKVNKEDILRFILFDKLISNFNCIEQRETLKKFYQNFTVKFAIKVINNEDNSVIHLNQVNVHISETIAKYTAYILFELFLIKRKGRLLKSYILLLSNKLRIIKNYCTIFTSKDFVMIYDWNLLIPIKYTPLVYNYVEALIYSNKVNDCEKKLLYWTSKYNYKKRVLIELRTTNLITADIVKFYVEKTAKLIDLNQYLYKIFYFKEKLNNSTNIKIIEHNMYCFFFVSKKKDSFYNVTSINLKKNFDFLIKPIFSITANLSKIIIFYNNKSDPEFCKKNKLDVLNIYDLVEYNVEVRNVDNEILFTNTEYAKKNITFLMLARYFETKNIMKTPKSIWRHYTQKNCVFVVEKGTIHFFTNFDLRINAYVKNVERVIFWSNEVIMNCIDLLNKYKKK